MTLTTLAPRAAVDIVDADLWPGLGHLWARALLNDLERLVRS